MESDKPARGRPPIAPEDRLEQRSIRLTAAHWAKIDANGGVPWLRAVIQRAKGVVPPAPTAEAPAKRRKKSPQD